MSLIGLQAGKFSQAFCKVILHVQLSAQLMFREIWQTRIVDATAKQIILLIL